MRESYLKPLLELYTKDPNFGGSIARGNNRRTQPMNDRALYYNTAAGGSFSSGAVSITATIAALGAAAASLAL